MLEDVRALHAVDSVHSIGESARAVRRAAYVTTRSGPSCAFVPLPSCEVRACERRARAPCAAQPRPSLAAAAPRAYVHLPSGEVRACERRERARRAPRRLGRRSQRLPVVSQRRERAPCAAQPPRPSFAAAARHPHARVHLSSCEVCACERRERAPCAAQPRPSLAAAARKPKARARAPCAAQPRPSLAAAALHALLCTCRLARCALSEARARAKHRIASAVARCDGPSCVCASATWRGARMSEERARAPCAARSLGRRSQRRPVIRRRERAPCAAQPRPSLAAAAHIRES